MALTYDCAVFRCVQWIWATMGLFLLLVCFRGVFFVLFFCSPNVEFLQNANANPRILAKIEIEQFTEASEILNATRVIS